MTKVNGRVDGDTRLCFAVAIRAASMLLAMWLKNG